MAGFKNKYLITFTGKTERAYYEELEMELETPYDWHRPKDIEVLFELIRHKIQEDFEKFELLGIEKI